MQGSTLCSTSGGVWLGILGVDAEAERYGECALRSDDLTSTQSWRGTFWLPDKPDESHEGFVDYEPAAGVRIRFISGFDDRKKVATSSTGYAVTQGSGRFPLIHGVVDGSFPVTLIDCRVVRHHTGWATDAVRDQDMSASRVLSGVHLGQRDAAVFSGFAVELENLTEWDRHDEMTIFVDRSEESPRRENWRVHVEPMQPLTATVGDLTIEIVRQYC